MANTKNDQKNDSLHAMTLRQKALARWDNEGGAGPDGPQKNDVLGDPTAPETVVVKPSKSHTDCVPEVEND